MSKTLGYYLLEQTLRKFNSWPTTKGLRGYIGLLLLFISVGWSANSTLREFFKCRLLLEECLFHVEIIIISITYVSVHAVILNRNQQFIETIHILSNFKKFGIPSQLKVVDSLTKTFIKIARILSFLVLFTTSNWMIFNNSCEKIKKITQYNHTVCHLIVSYDSPVIIIKPYIQGFITLFQMFSFMLNLNVFFIFILYYYYTIETLIIRLQHIADLLDSIQFVPDQKKSTKFRKVIVYHQHVYRLFDYVTIYNSLIIPQRFCIMICIVISASRLYWAFELPSFEILMTCVILMFIVHSSGQRLMNICSTITDSIYNLNWYDADLSIQKDVLIFLCLSQKSFEIKLGFFGSLSYPTMANEYKKIFTYFNAVLKLAAKKN